MHGLITKVTRYTQPEQNDSRPTGAFNGKFLFWSLRKDEDLSNGLAPKDPNANLSTWKQVDCRYETQYISTTATLEKAREWAKKSVTADKMDVHSIRIVEIDEEKMEKPNEEIINLTDPVVLHRVFPAKNNHKRNFATYYKEVLVKGYITSDCLRLLNPREC